MSRCRRASILKLISSLVDTIHLYLLNARYCKTLKKLIYRPIVKVDLYMNTLYTIQTFYNIIRIKTRNKLHILFRDKFNDN